MTTVYEGRQPRITKGVRDRIRRLLPMEYRPSEIATVLGVNKDTVLRGWVRAGLPHRRTDGGEIGIIGTVLAAWLRQQIRKPRVKLGPGQGYCLRCHKAVTMRPPFTREIAGNAVLVQGTCPQCQGSVARFVSGGNQ